MISNNLDINEVGHLTINGYDTLALASEYKTPLYLMDEDRIRENCRLYQTAMQKYFGSNALPLYASKAACFKALYRIIKEEGLGIDVVSSGEIYTAYKAQFPLDKAYFHSNNKTKDDIAFAMKHQVGYFVVDGIDELNAIEKIANELNIVQKVLLRLTPGIDPHTFEAVKTGKVDSKFGSAIETGQAEEITRYCLTLDHLKLMGYHCHIGSQIFDIDPYERTIDIVFDFLVDMQNKLDYTAKELNLGGGFGVRYTDQDPVIDIEDNIKNLAKIIKKHLEKGNLPLPGIRLEPGRSIVADAGMTLYTVGSVKNIPGYKNYVSIDGGMTDNPRFALYGSKYTVCNAGKMNEKPSIKYDVVGRCCESGDIIQKDVILPETRYDDTIAVLTTGAYNYSMASNYNRLCRPPIVMLTKHKLYIAVKRESLDYLIKNDI